MKTVNIEIKGVSPLLINRFKEEAEVPVKMKKKGGGKDYGTPREQAEQTPYYDERTKKLWIPSSWLMGTISSVASDYKLTGTRKSVKSVSGGAILPMDEKIYFAENYKVANIEVDSRPVVIQRARIMRHRARLETWTLKTQIMVDDSILDVDQVHEILSDAGRRAGMGDYRPPKGGPFGRFSVTQFKIANEKKVTKKKKVTARRS